MNFKSFLRYLGARGSRRSTKRNRKPLALRERLHLEALESRVLLSGDVPRIIKVVPPDGSSTFSTHPQISIQFSELMNQVDIQNTANYLLFGSTGNKIAVDAPISYDGSTNTATLSYNGGNDLVADTYTLFVRGDQLHDVDDGFPISQPGQILVASAGNQTVSVVNMPGNGRLGAISNYTAGSGTSPFDVAIADVTGDGIPDLISVNPFNDSVAIYAGLAGGGFANSPTTTLPMPFGSEADSIAVADFNGDGNLDIAVADFGTNDVTVFLNAGGGSFPTQQRYPAGMTPQAIVAADFTGSGHIDLAVADGGQDAVQVLINKGNGTFSPAVAFPTGRTTLTDIAAGNLSANPAHPADIAVSSGNGVAVLTNTSTTKGVPNFSAGQAISTVNTTSVAIGELDTDNLADIAATTPQNGGQVLVFTNGVGGFGNGVTYAANANPKGVNIADINGDGLNDLLVANAPATGQGSVSVLLNNGGSVFGAPTAYTVDHGAQELAVHLNAQKVVDLAATANGFPSDDVSVLRASGGVFEVSRDFPLTATNVNAVASGDFNGDGLKDVAIADFNTNTVQVYLRKPDGSFATPTTYTVGSGPVSLTVGDLTGTGKLDIAVVNQNDNTVQILANDGMGNFTVNAPLSTGKHPTGVVLADFNGDGKLDMAVSHNGGFFGGTLPSDEGVTVFLGKGDHTFFTPNEYLPGVFAVALAAGDFDGNKKIGLAVLDGSQAGTVSILHGVGNGTFATSSADVFAAGENPNSIAVGDLNGDRLPDIVVTNQSVVGSGTNPIAYISVLLNTPGIGFSGAIRTDVFSGPNALLQSVAIADVHQGLYPDVVASVADTTGTAGAINNLVTLLGNGDGTFQTPQFFATGGGGPAVPPSFITVASDPFIDLTSFTVLTSTVQSNLIKNGAFGVLDLATEKGNLLGWQTAVQNNSHGLWKVQTGTLSPLSEVGVPAPPQGQYAAMADQQYTALPITSVFGDRNAIPTSADYDGTNIIYQDFTIPSTASKVTLSFNLYVNNNDETNSFGYSDPNVTPALDYFPTSPNRPANQQVRIDILDPNVPNTDIFNVTPTSAGGSVLQNLYITSPSTPRVFGYVLNPKPGNLNDTTPFDITQFKGRTLRLRIAETNNKGKLVVGLDNVKVLATFVDQVAPTISNLHLRNPGIDATNLFGGKTTDTTIIGRVDDNGSPSNIQFVAIDTNNDGDFNGPEDFKVTRLDALGDFAASLPLNLPGQYTIGVQAVDHAGNSTTTTFTFVDQGPSLTTFQARGPGPIRFIGQGINYKTVSGRIQAVAVDPRDPGGKIIYVGSDNGGVWKTNDGGANWTPLTDFLTDPTLGPISVSVGALAVDPNNPDNVFAGTGVADNKPTSQPGIGILKSTDAGKSWTLIGNDIFGGARITKITISDVNPNTNVPVRIFVAVASGGKFGPGLFSSTDGGQTWVNALDPATMQLDAGGVLGAGHALASVTDVAVDRLSSGEEILWVGLGNIGLSSDVASTGVWKTTNGGGTWIQQAGGHDTKGAAVFHQKLPVGTDPTVDIGRVEIALPGETEVLGPDGRVHPSNRPGEPGVSNAGDEGVAYVLMNNRKAPRTDLELNTTENFDNESGLFKTAANSAGQSWTHVMIRQNDPDPPASNLHNFETVIMFGDNLTQPSLDEANAVGALQVDPTDANVVYIGGSTRFIQDPAELFSEAHGFLRVDTTNMRDTNYASPFDPYLGTKYPNDGDDQYKAYDAALLVTPPHDQGRYPNGDPYHGEGAFWYDLQQGTTGVSDFSRLRLPATIHALVFDGSGRLLVGTEGGLWRGVSQGFHYDTTSGGSLTKEGPIWSIEHDLGLKTPTEPGMIFTDLNGNLQITDEQSLAIDPIDRHATDASFANFGWAKTSGTLPWSSSNDIAATTTNPGPPLSIDPFDSPAPYSGIVRAGPRDPGHPANPSVIFRTYANIVLNNPPTQFQISVHGGEQGTFNSITSGIDLVGLANYPNFAVNPIQINETGTPSTELLYAGTKVFESDDAGASWQQASAILSPGDPITALAFGTGADDVFYVGTQAGKVFVSLNNGADGFPLRNAGLPGQPIGGIVVDSTNALNAFVAFRGFGTGLGHVFHTTDGGVTWTNITGNLPDVPAYAVAFDPRPKPGVPVGRLYVGTQVGVFVSTDTGATWALLGEGLPHVPVVDLQFDPVFEKLVGATLGRSTFEINTDIHGPQVVGFSPATPILPGIAAVTVTFNKPVDPRTFDTSKIRQFRGPNGPITPLSVVEVNPIQLDHTVFQITFVPQSTDGIYSLSIGPNITDFVGNAMDQNGNGVNGEDPGDRFSVRFAINTTDDGRYVTATYHDLLNRPADTEGFLSLISGVDAARFQQLQANALSIITSDEARRDEISSISPVLQRKPVFPFYQSLLHRTPSGPEVDFWLQMRKQGMTEETVISGIAGSDEYFQNSGAGTDAGFVNQLYSDILGRPADTAGFNGFVTFLATAEYNSRVGLSSSLVSSDQYFGNLTATLYQKYLKRPASPADISNSVAQFHGGLRDEGLIAILMGSNEYFVNRAGSNNSAWLDAAYSDLFGRAVDPGGRSFWMGQLNAGVSRFSVATQLLASGEYLSIQVTNYYTKYLARVPSQTEVANFVAALQHGATDEAVISTMVSSGEYFQRHKGSATTQAAQDNNWVNAAFSDVLNRGPNGTESNNFLTTLGNAERTSHAVVVSAFVGSDEYRRNLITQTYLTFLGRTPGPADINVWLPLLVTPSGGPGTASPDEQFFSDIVGSGEFFFDQFDPANGLHTNSQWITSVYNGFLGRKPDPITELPVALNSLLTRYQPQRLAEATAMDMSTEYRQDLVVRLFTIYLRRTPTPAEIADRVQQLASGATDENVINVLISSTEYFQNPKGKGGAGDNSVWLSQAYKDLFGRDTSNDPGAQNLLNQLNQGLLTRSQIATMLLASNEYRTRVVSNIYLTLLGRAVTGTELTGWLTAPGASATDEQIIAAVISSSEYFQRQLTPGRLAINFP